MPFGAYVMFEAIITYSPGPSPYADVSYPFKAEFGYSTVQLRVCNIKSAMFHTTIYEIVINLINYKTAYILIIKKGSKNSY